MNVFPYDVKVYRALWEQNRKPNSQFADKFREVIEMQPFTHQLECQQSAKDLIEMVIFLF